jgi:hypothetical protein
VQKIPEDDPVVRGGAKAISVIKIFTVGDFPCPIGQISNNGYCWPQIASGASGCAITAQCQNGATCMKGMCVAQMCIGNQVLYNSLCYPIIMPGSAGCVVNMQCVGRSTCANNVCTCPQGQTGGMYNMCGVHNV